MLNMFFRVNKFSARNYCTNVKNTAKLRNSRFTKSKFINLQFNKHPRPETDLSEGYKFSSTEILLPGFTESITANFAKYDKNLHNSFKKYYTEEEFQDVDVFKSNCNN